MYCTTVQFCVLSWFLYDLVSKQQTQKSPFHCKTNKWILAPVISIHLSSRHIAFQVSRSKSWDCATLNVFTRMLKADTFIAVNTWWEGGDHRAKYQNEKCPKMRLVLSDFSVFQRIRNGYERERIGTCATAYHFFDMSAKNQDFDRLKSSTQSDFYKLSELC